MFWLEYFSCVCYYYQEVVIMAKNSDIGLIQLDNGNWCYRIVINRKNLKIDTTCRQDENGNPYKTKKAARDAREQKIAELKQPKETKASDIKDVKLSTIYENYINNGSSGKAYATIRKQQSMWENHINKNFGNKNINDITLDELQNYLQKMYLYGDNIEGFSGYSFKYVESFLKFFYLLFGSAYNNDFIDPIKYNKMFVNRGTRLTMPKMTQDDAKEYANVSIYTPKQIKQLDSVFSRGNCYTAFLLGYYCGLRISETFALTIPDINISDKTITIDKQLLYQDGCWCLCPVKTLKSVRTIDIPDNLADHLHNKIFDYLESQQKDSYRDYETIIDKTTKQHKIISKVPFINRKENGELLTPNSIKYWTKTIKTELNIDFLFHSLRKTHATMMANANTPVIELMSRLGHKKYETTMAYYINSNALSKEALKTNINNLDYSNIPLITAPVDPFE